MNSRLRSISPYAIVLVTALVILAMMGAVYQRIRMDRQVTVEAAYREDGNLAVTLAAENSRALANVERELRAIARALAAGSAIEPALQQADPGVVNPFLRVDANGIGHRLDAPGPAVNEGDREFFQWHRSHPSDAVFIGRNLRARVNGKAAIPMSIRLDRADGTFDGVLVGYIEPQYFVRLYGKPQLGPGGRVGLVGTDGFVRADTTGGKSVVPREMPAHSLLLRALASAPSGHFLSRGRLDGVTRFVSYATLPAYPSLVIAVGRAESDVLAAHRRRSDAVITAFAIAGIAVLLVARLAWIAAGRQREHLRALAASEARYRAIFENAVEGIYQSTPEGRLVTANPAMARIAGFSSPQELLRSARDVRHGYRDPSLRDEFRRRIEADGFVNEFEYELMRGDGTCTWISENARVVRDEDGRVIAYEGFISDIGARKREEQVREQAAQLALRRYQQLLERLGSLAANLARAGDLPAIYRAVLDFTRLSAPVNAMFVSLYDAERKERRRVYAWSEGHEEDTGALAPLPTIDTPHARAVATGEAVVMGDMRPDPSVPAAGADETLPQSALVVPMHVMGRVIGGVEVRCVRRDAYRQEHVIALQMAAPLAAMAIDNVRLLAEERGHRERAEQAERRTAAVLDSALDGIVSIDHDNRIAGLNPAAEELFGIAADEARGRRLEVFVAGAPHHAGHDGAMPATGRIVEGYVETRALRADGTTFPAEVSIVQIPGLDPPAYTGFVRDITRRKRAEAALRESEARYRKAAAELGAIVDESLDVICSLDREGRFVHVSAAARRVWGYRPDELIGRPVRERVHADDLDKTVEALERVIGGEPTRAFENRTLRRDGSAAHMMWSARWIEHEQTMFCVGRDMTEVKLVTEANKLLSERLRETLERLTSGFATLDAAWRFTYVNREAERIFGRRRETLLGRVCWDEIPGSYSSPFADAFREAMTRRGATQVEAYHAPYGRWFEARTYPTDDGGLAIYFNDVTERREAIQRLEESERRFESVALATSDVVWDWHADTGRTWRSAGLKAFYGHDETTCAPTLEGLLALIHEEDRERVRESVHEALASGASKWSAEYRFRKGDGSYAIVADRGTILRDASGRPVRAVGGMADITEQRELERQLMRTQRLDSLGTLAGGLAHDLNNVLTPITMGLNLLAEGSLTRDERTILETVRQSAARGADMVKQVLSFARGMEGQRVEVQPRLVVQELERLMRETFPRNIEIVTRIPERLPIVSGDPTELHQVLLNLCVNARDAMPDGGKLTLRLHHGQVPNPMRSVNGDVAPGHYVRVEVEDTGCGIDESLLERIFDPFFTTKRRGEGTGLGLSTTLAIVRRHGGHLQVRSKPAAGSCFTVMLPVAEEGALAGKRPPRVKLRRGSGETILVVDDEHDIRELAEAALRAAGYRAVTAADGREALAALRDGADARVVVTDMMMPGMDGRTLVRRLRREHPALPVICTSGVARVDCADAPEAAECPFLPKPYTAEALIAAVQEALERAAANARGVAAG